VGKQKQHSVCEWNCTLISSLQVMDYWGYLVWFHCGCRSISSNPGLCGPRPSSWHLVTALATLLDLLACQTTCKHAYTANTNTYFIEVKSTRSWGYVRDSLRVTLLQVYKKYGVSGLQPAISGPAKQAAHSPSTVWKLTVVVPAKQCAGVKEALRNALRNAIKAFKKPPTIVSTKIYAFV
jgi:hypothetical protein